MKRVALPILLAAGLLAPISVNAQGTSSSTPVIGYYKFNVPNGKSIWNCAFMTKKEFQGAATSIAQAAPNSVITQTGAGWAVNAFNTSANPATQSSHFVEILSGPLAGTMADIVSNTATTVTVEGLGVGTSSVTYCIRKHTTLGTVFKTAGLTEFEDEILIFNDAGASFKFQFDGTPGAEHIVDAATQSIISDNVVLYPAQAVVLTIGTPKTLTFGGNEVSYVKSGVTKIPLYGGVTNLVGLYDPLVATAPLTSTAANESHTIGSIGLRESALTPFEDEIAVFGISGGSFTRTGLFYYDDTNNPGDIVDSVSGANRNNVLIPNGTGFLVKPLSGSRIYTQPQFQNP